MHQELDGKELLVASKEDPDYPKVAANRSLGEPAAPARRLTVMRRSLVVAASLAIVLAACTTTVNSKGAPFGGRVSPLPPGVVVFDFTLSNSASGSSPGCPTPSLTVLVLGTSRVVPMDTWNICGHRGARIGAAIGAVATVPPGSTARLQGDVGGVQVAMTSIQGLERPVVLRFTSGIATLPTTPGTFQIRVSGQWSGAQGLPVEATWVFEIKVA